MADQASLTIKINANKDASVDRAFKESSDAVKKFSGDIESAFGNLQSLIAGLGMVSFAKSFVDAASQAEQYKITLLAVTKSQTEANRIYKEAVEYAKTTPFEVGDIVKASVQLQSTLKSTGVDIDRVRTAAANLAAVFGQGKADSLFQASNALAKGMVGSAEGVEIMRNQFGLTVPELAKFGAVTKNQTEMVYAQAGAIEKNREAILKWVESKFGNAIELQANTAKTAFSNFSDSIKQFMVSVGDMMLPKLVEWTKSLTGLIEKTSNMSNIEKQNYANLILYGTAVTSLIIGLTGLAFAYNQVTAALGAFNIGLALATPSLLTATLATAGWVAGIAALIVVLKTVNEQLKEEIELHKINAAEIKKEDMAMQKRYDALRRFNAGEKLDKKDYANAITAQIEKVKNAEDSLLALRREQNDPANHAKYFENPQQRESINAQIKSARDRLQLYRDTLDTLRLMAQAETGETKKIEKAPETEKQRIDRLKEEMKTLERKQDLDQATEEDKIRLIEIYKNLADAVKKVYNAEDDAHKYRKQAHELEKKMGNENMENALNRVERLRKAGQLSADEEIKWLQLIKQQYATTNEEKEKMDDKIAEAKDRKVDASLKKELQAIEKIKADKNLSAKQEIDLLEDLKQKYINNANIQEQLQNKILQLQEHARKESENIRLKSALQANEAFVAGGGGAFESIAQLEQIKQKYAQTQQEKLDIDKRIIAERKRLTNEVYDAERQNIEEIKTLHGLSKNEEIAMLQALRDKYIDNGVIRKKIEDDIIKLQKQSYQDRVNANKTLVDEIAKLSMDSTQYEVYQLNKKIEEYRKKGADEVAIKKYIELEKQRLSKDTHDKENSQLDAMINKLKSMREQRGNAPTMTIEEAMLSQSIGMQSTFSPFAANGNSADLSKLGGSSIGMLSSQMQNIEGVKGNVDNSVTIGSLILGGSKAEQVGKALKDLVNVGSYNTSESME